jgi:hypothetical protein
MATWKYWYMTWHWNGKTNPLEGSYDRVQEAGEKGWELVSMTAVPHIAFGATQGATFVAMFKRQDRQ